MEKIRDIPLTSSEISGLWSTYMGDSMAICVFRYFINRTNDNEVLPLLQHAQKLSEQHIQFLIQMCNQEQLPIPVGFKENDVDINAPRSYYKVNQIRKYFWLTIFYMVLL